MSGFICYDGDVSAMNRIYHHQKGGKDMIYTTRGPIHKSELGVTLGHEHIKWESDEFHANKMYFDKKISRGGYTFRLKIYYTHHA